MATLGIIGAGHVGSNVARAAVAAGYEVVISNSRGPESLAGLVEELGPRARAATAERAAAEGDFVLVAIPLKDYREVPVAPLVGKVVLDANNYYPERDGRIPELEDESTTTSELLQAHLPQSRVVKAFNHITAAEVPTTGGPAGDPDRRALAIAGDDPEAKALVAGLYDELGFASLDLGPLAEGWRVQRDTPCYVRQLNAAQLRQRVDEARRYRDM